MSQQVSESAMQASPICQPVSGRRRSLVPLLACMGLVAAAAWGAQAVRKAVAAGPVATGPVVAFDTNRGRITCRLFAKEKPATVALFTGLATGKLTWLDATTNAPVNGTPLYDASVMYGVSAGAAGGRRINVAPGTGTQSLKPEVVPSLKFDRPGRLAMRVTNGDLDGRSFYVLNHAEERTPQVESGIFGQCEDASTPVVSAISHELLAVDNHSDTPVVLNRVIVAQPGEALPPPAENVPLAKVADVEVVTHPVEPIVAPEPTGPKVRIDTAMGVIRCQLFQQTPIATSNFVDLATGKKPYTDPKTKQLVHGRHFYDGLAFGRVVPDFMIQNADLPNDPGGGDTIGFHFGNEIVPGLSFDRPGRLAYANGGPDTNESEFFITEHPIRRLDNNYTIFGQCDTDSVKVVEAIARQPRNVEDHALKPVRIVKVTVE